MTTRKNPVIVKIEISSTGRPSTYYCAGKTRKEALVMVADYLGQAAEQATRMGGEVISHTNTKLVVSFNKVQTTYRIVK